MNNKAEEIIIDLMTRLYEAQGYAEIPFRGSASERNIFEAEMKNIYYNFEELLYSCNDELNDEVDRLTCSCAALAEENRRLIEILKNVSEVVNTAWN